jgi:hypothetical protein
MNIQEVDAMTVQQAIDYSLDKLVKQGKRCMEGSNCVYGDGEGKHCAIGWLLNSGDIALMAYEESVMGLVKYCHCVPDLIIRNADTFHSFQRFHDESTKGDREIQLHELTAAGIDTSHPNFQAWLDLGE